jgi:hypothetical protein
MNTSRFVLAFVIFIDTGLFPLSNMLLVGDVFDIQDCIPTKY